MLYPGLALAFVAAAALSSAAPAQTVSPSTALEGSAEGQSPSFDAGLLDACLSVRHGLVERSGCIGLAAARCSAGLTVAPAGAFAACAMAERDQWQARLDSALAALRDSAAATDTAGGVAADQGRGAAIDAAQQAWEGWRAAECHWSRADAAGGGAEDLAEIECEMTLTAARAIALSTQLERRRGP